MFRMLQSVKHIFQELRAFISPRVAALRCFPADQAGGVLIMTAVAIVPLIGFVGIGTDAARGYLVWSRLSSALDAAALAGGRSFAEASREDDARMFFNANFTAGFMGATVVGPTIVTNEEAGTIELTADANIPTIFMSLFGFDELAVSASTEVTRTQDALDVVLAVDMSGSMGFWTGGETRISAARTAAELLVNTLFGNDATKEHLNIGLVPWNGKVNVTLNGSTFDSGATVANPVTAFSNPVTGVAQNQVYFANNSPVPLLSAPPSDWQGCVFSRYLDDADDTNDADVTMPPATVGGTDWHAWEPVGPEGEPVSGGTCTMSVGGDECTPCLNAGITALQNGKQPMLDAIGALTDPEGFTNIPQGLGWAWRVLKPEAPFTEAVLDPDYTRKQAIVLLTDGENHAGSGDGYKTVFGSGAAGRPEMNARLLSLVANIKADGVLVYVIQFANGGGDLQTLLQQVASGTGAPYYHYAPDGATLQRVFQEIANHLSKLRLSK